jgi:hypothetical protein
MNGVDLTTENIARRSRGQNTKFEKSEFGWTEIFPKMNEFQDLHRKEHKRKAMASREDEDYREVEGFGIWRSESKGNGGRLR